MRFILFLTLIAAPAALAEAPLALTAYLSEAEVIFLGEVHDNSYHHQSQAEIIAALDPKAVVYEMLTPEQAEVLADAKDRSPDALDAALGWSDTGWPGMDVYHPVLAAATLPVGVQNSREEARLAYKEGAATAFGDGAERFGLTSSLPEVEQAERETLQFEAHCEAMPLDMMGGMVEAQRFRDARIADAALTALEQHGAPVVVVTGNGHAQQQWGAAKMVAQEAKVVSVAHIEPGGLPEGFDLVLQTPAAERDDPCAAFE